MTSTTFFSGISRSDAKKLTECLRGRTHAYMQGEKILHLSDERLSTIACVIQGSVSIYCIGNGEEPFLLETLSFGDVFGELFYPPLPGIEYAIIAETDCEILFINYSAAVSTCHKNCYYHLALIDNLFRIGAEKVKAKNLHIHILQNRRIKNKLLVYLKSLQKIYNSDVFDIPLSQTELANYLAVDRSAMSRELSNLKNEGLIRLKGRHCEIVSHSELHE